jgi:F0F1-type ATP synthase membrane subunit b/b'
LHKIREILVGPTTRSIDERLDTFRKQIDTANQKSQHEVATRLESLEKQMRSALEHQLVNNELAQRKFESALDELRKQTTASSERIIKTHAETKEWIALELESIRAALDLMFASFRAEFVDRQSMASLFSEMSLQVAGQSAAPIDPSRPDADLEVVLDQRKKP